MTARVGGGSPDRVARGLPTGGHGSKVYVLCAEPKEYKHFRPGTRPGGSGTRPGGSVTGVTEKLFMCQMFMCLFPPPIKGRHFGIRLVWYHCGCFFSLRVPNGVFQTVLHLGLRQRHTPSEGRRMPENTSLFKYFGAFRPCGS